MEGVPEEVRRREERYVQKIKNDVDERLYDLLVLHLRDVHERIRIHGEDNEDLRTTLVTSVERAIRYLRKRTDPYTRRTYDRYVLLLCNTLLKFNTQRQDMKDLKKRIIADFLQAEQDEHGYIPLDYQLNEVRITYDVSYLAYLTGKHLEEGRLHEALSCLNAVELIEPDYPDLDERRSAILSSTTFQAPIQAPLPVARGMQVLLDSNIALSFLMGPVGDYRLGEPPSCDTDALVHDNEVHLSASVYRELEDHLAFMKVGIRSRCRKLEQFDAEAISATLDERLRSLWGTYGISDLAADDTVVEEIASFYRPYLPTLEHILHEKCQGLPVSHKLRKLAHRDGLQPENGDMRLLAEAIALSAREGAVAICSQDKDFTVFAGDIHDRFGITVCLPPPRRTA